METLRFKTNIKCSACMATLTPVLNNLPGLVQWEVDLHNPDRILSVQKENRLVTEQIVKALVTKGYKAELV